METPHGFPLGVPGLSVGFHAIVKIQGADGGEKLESDPHRGTEIKGAKRRHLHPPRIKKRPPKKDFTHGESRLDFNIDKRGRILNPHFIDIPPIKEKGRLIPCEASENIDPVQTEKLDGGDVPLVRPS